MSDVDNVLVAALRLPPAARAEVVAELISSLDESGPVDEGVEEAWTEEVRRRVAELEAGTVKPIPWSEARRRILAAAGGRREAP